VSVAREVQHIDLLTRKIESMHHYEFTLFISQRQRGGMCAVESVEQVCERHIKNDYKLKIVDIEDEPDEAERNYVLATPTLIVEWPLPKRRVIGCFTDLEELARVMGVCDGCNSPSAVSPRDAD
jgi:circadian clock protein KaiB